MRYKKLKELIEVESHRDIVDENEDFWRFKFYSILDLNSEALTHRYFISTGGDRFGNGSKIDRKSIAVIFDFAAWKGEDPLDEVDDIELFADRISLFNHRGLHDFLGEDGYWDKIMVRKDAIQEKREET